MSQSQIILEHLKKYGSITPKAAYDRYGIMRLGARIHELKKLGHPIVTVMETQKNRFDVETTFARYYWKGERNG